MTEIIVIDVKIPLYIYKNIEDKQAKTCESSWYTRGEDVFHSQNILEAIKCQGVRGNQVVDSGRKITGNSLYDEVTI